MKKLICLLIIIVVGYILLVFTFPDLANKLWTTLHLQKVNTFLVSFKNVLNETVTQMPEKQDFVNTYNQTLSGATKVWEWVKTWVDAVKEKIDNLRKTLSGAENQADALKDSYNKAKQIIDTTATQIEEAKKVANDINAISNNIINVVNTWAIQ